MSEAFKFLADRLAEKTTWAAILGLLSLAGVAIAADDATLQNLALVGGLLAGVVGILTQERK